MPGSIPSSRHPHTLPVRNQPKSKESNGPSTIQHFILASSFILTEHKGYPNLSRQNYFIPNPDQPSTHVDGQNKKCRKIKASVIRPAPHSAPEENSFLCVRMLTVLKCACAYGERKLMRCRKHGQASSKISSTKAQVIERHQSLMAKVRDNLTRIRRFGKPGPNPTFGLLDFPFSVNLIALIYWY